MDAYAFDGSFYGLKNDEWIEIPDFDLTQTLGELGADGYEVWGADCTASTQPWILYQDSDGWTMKNTPHPLIDDCY